MSITLVVSRNNATSYPEAFRLKGLLYKKSQAVTSLGFFWTKASSPPYDSKMKSIAYLFIAINAFILLGCDSISDSANNVDQWSFKRLGGTVFQAPSLLSLKEIHLAGSQLADKVVVVEGQVSKLNELGTYLILKDQDAKLLVVLTDLIGVRQSLQDSPKPVSIKVLGTIQRGSEGLPFVKAQSLKIASL